MIDKEKYVEILEKGLTLDHYFVMCNIKNGVDLVENKRIQGFINLLTKKGYIKDDTLTEKGIALVENCEFSNVVVETKQEKINLAEWVITVHQHCVDKLFTLTGKRQVKGMLNGRKYAFMPNATDLGKNLLKIITLYKLKDYDKIERLLLQHIETCHKTNHWFPVLYYYVHKENKSLLVTDMEADEEEVEIEDDQFKITKTKDLF